MIYDDSPRVRIVRQFRGGYSTIWRAGSRVGPVRPAALRNCRGLQGSGWRDDGAGCGLGHRKLPRPNIQTRRNPREDIGRQPREGTRELRRPPAGANPAPSPHEHFTESSSPSLCPVPQHQVSFGGGEAADPSIAVADRNNHRIQVLPSVSEDTNPPVAWTKPPVQRPARSSESTLTWPRLCRLGGGQVWTSAGEAFGGCFGTKGEVRGGGGGGGRGGDWEQKKERPRNFAGPDYGGCLAAPLAALRLCRPAGVCWCEGEEGRNWLVVADTGNHRLQLLDLDQGTVRVLCGGGHHHRGRSEIAAPV